MNTFLDLALAVAAIICLTFVLDVVTGEISLVVKGAPASTSDNTQHEQH
jgi:hypothetical protein